MENRRFNPLPRDIRNHMYRATVKLRLSKIDQENLHMKIEEWKKSAPNDSFHFRSYKDGNVGSEVERECYFYNENGDRIDDKENLKENNDNEKKGQRLLFVHQTENQKRFLKRYGNVICLLDATYKTTKYAIPLFFVAVKTNVDYQVVGSFATQDETTHAIKEALQVLKGWNSLWQPQCFMVDNFD